MCFYNLSVDNESLIYVFITYICVVFVCLVIGISISSFCLVCILMIEVMVIGGCSAIKKGLLGVNVNKE